MPRSNRRARESNADDEQPNSARILKGRLTTEKKHAGLWYVQPIQAASSTKTYSCPGCGLDITPGTAHVVTWRADGLMGEEDAIAARRHWHSHCWTIAH
jgi:hypothetical protein